MFEADAGNYPTVIDWRQRRYEMDAGASQLGAIGEYPASEKLKSSSWSWHLSSNGRDAGEARHLALESICRWYDGHQPGASEALEDRSFKSTQVRKTCQNERGRLSRHRSEEGRAPCEHRGLGR